MHDIGPLMIEVRAFGKLHFLFKERGWEMPINIEPSQNLTAEMLREKLDIPAEDVEVVFINHRVCSLSTFLKGGDRVAFVPPGVPTIHRFMLGFYSAKDDTEDKNS